MRATSPLAPLLFLGLASAGSALAAGPDPSLPAEMPTDRVIVRVKADGMTAKRAIPREELQALAGRTLGERLEFHRVMGDGALVMRLPRRMAPSQIAERARTVADAGIDIEPDRIAFPQLAPNDPFYASQWSLIGTYGINAFTAWDTTTGSPSLVVAILDTGMLNHTDLAGRWLPGYDFIADTDRSNDGTARDANATDPGDWVTLAESTAPPFAGCPVTNSRWHGTLMAGVIAANANNGLKIAGINWNSKLLPVRVAGKCGGYTSDIADGMRWAAGLAIPGDPSVPANPNPAKVLNVSLAAQSATCDTSFQNAIAAVTAAGATIVVSAGNSGAAANQYAPGNCSGVITVGATDIFGGRPAYANTGDPIALAAPGGVGSGPGSVISLTDGGTTVALNDNAHAGTFGSSIAAAHVTGVASLVLSVRPNLTPAQVRDVLVTNARAFPANAVANGSAANCTTAQCGAGILDATLALNAVTHPDAGKAGIAAGREHTLAVRTDGTLFAWGPNDWGQLGDGTTTTRANPVAVTGIDGVVAMAGGGGHSLALRIDGSVWAWGRNDHGQLGNGAIDGNAHPVPVRVAGLSQVTSIATGENHSAAITRDGKLWVWGYNDIGVLAIGTTVDQATPAQVPGLPFVASVVAGNGYTCVTQADTTVKCWGLLKPLGAVPTLTATPTAIGNVSQSTRLSPGPDANHRISLDSLGTMRIFGANETAQTGLSATAAPQFNSPGAVPPIGAITAVAVGARHSLGLGNDGQVYALGDNAEGQLGRGNAPGIGTNGAYTEAAQAVLGVRSAVRVAAAGDRGLAVRQDGSVVAWGAGYLGNGTQALSGETSAQRVAGVGGTGFLDLGALVIPADPFLSTGFPDRSDVPLSSVQVSNPSMLLFDVGFPITVSTSGGQFSIGCAGPWVTSGLLSVGNTFCLRVTAAGTPGTTNTVTISDSFSITTRSFSVTTPFGDGVPARTFLAPQVGLATAATATSGAVTITGVASTTTVSPGPGLTTSAGCTGTFTSGNVAVANGQALCVRDTASASPGVTRQPTFDAGSVTTVFPITTANPAFRTAPALAVSHQTVLGLRDDGVLFAWGDGRTGQLGGAANGSQSEAPLAVATLSLLKSVAVSRYHGAAAGSDGTIWTWGRADYGQAGRNFVVERTVPPHPVPVAAPLTAQKVAVGKHHALALDASGNVWAWGRNNEGQVGANCGLLRCPVPMQVTFGPAFSAIAAAGNTSYAITAAGAVYCWGRCYDAFGYLFQSTPTLWNALAGVKAIASTTGGHWLALQLDGTVRAWGENEYGQLGNNTTISLPAIQSVPVTVPGLTNVVQVAAGGFDGRDERTPYVNSHSLALRSDGTVWSWGDNQFGQLGDGTLATRLVPVQVAGVSAVTAIGAGYGFGAALKADGRVVAWGREQFGELGNGDGSVFTFPSPGSPVTVAGVGAAGTLALGVADNTAFAPQTDVPVSSVRTSNAIVGAWANGSAISIAGGGQYSIGCTGTFTASAGTIAAGANVCVRLTAAPTLGTSVASTLTIAGVPRIFTVTTIAGDTTPDVFRFPPAAARPVNALVQSAAVTITGINGPVAVTVSGGEYAAPCGANPVFTAAGGSVAPGQTVCVRRVSAATPDTVATATLTVGTRSAPFHVITAVAPGFNATPRIAAVQGGAALRSDGTVFTWGFNLYGEVGDGTLQPRSTPGPLSTLSGVTTLDVARSHTLAVRSDGTVWAWGDNTDGRLGDGTQVASRVPLRVEGLPAAAAAVAGSYSHSVARLVNGEVWGWGSNAFGQLGTGNTQSSSVPVKANLAGFVVSLSTGLNHTLAVKSDGTVWCWGSCLESGLGNTQSTPAQVAPAVLTGIVEVAGSGEDYHALARKGDGTVLAWGSNTSGEVGNGTTTTSVFPPVPVSGLASVTKVAAGQFHSMALVDNAGARTLWTWGKNHFGQLGLGTSPTDGTAQSRNTPQRVAIADGAIGLDAGQYSSFAVMPDGNVLAWGIENLGSLGNGSTSFESLQQSLPIRVLGPNGDGYLSLQFVDTSPDPFAFPARFGVAPGATVQSNTVRITGLSAASPVAIAGGLFAKNCGGAFASAGTILNDETICVQVAAPGSFEASASATLTIGTGSGARSAIFTVRTRRASGSAPISPQVALGSAHSLVLANNGTVSGVGYNANGQLGNGTTLNTPTPLRVPGFTGVRRIASGAYHSLAVNADGTVSAWGYNAVGQLGLGVADSARANPTPVPGLANVVAVAAGDYHSLALLQDGTVKAWGFNFYGQVGNGTTTNQPSPVLVSGLSTVIAIAAGGQHSLALKADGTVVAWGANDSGQLGDGTTQSRSLPTPVSGLSTPATANVAALAAGTSHSLALRSSGSAWSWGANAQGQLGLGNTAPASVPTAIATLGTNVGLIAAGGNHSLAVKAGGSLFSWGANANGQLGDGLSANRTSPFAVATPAQATAVAAGARHSAAIDATGRAYLWGDNYFGQVGNRTGNFDPHAASLNVLRGDSRIVTGVGGSGGGTSSSSGSGVLSLDNLGGAFSFGTVAVGQPSSTPASYQNVAADTSIGALSVSTSGAGYSIGGACPSSLAPSDTCAFSIEFAAGSPGFYPGQLRIDSDLVGAPEFRELEANVVSAQSAALVMATTTASFPPTVVGTVSAPVGVTVTNAGTATLGVTSATSSSTAFGVTNGCATVAPGASCTIAITYAPAAVGTGSGSVTVFSNGGNAQVALLGTGIAATYDSVPDAFTFPAAPGVQPLSVVTSAAVAIAGLGGAAPVSVQGGEYSIGCSGTFTTAAGTVAMGQTVCVRHVASAMISTQVTTVLTVGGVSGSFTSTTTSTPSNALVTVTPAGNGSGTVTSDPAGIACGVACTAAFTLGTTVTLSATPSAGFYFAGWSGACTGAGACSFAVDGAKSVTATFTTAASLPRLANISTRMQVLTGNDVLIGGFIIGGSQAKTVVVRARGPSLAALGVPGVLANPVLQLFSGATQIAANDNWKEAANQATLAASGYAPSDDFESAIHTTLTPGAYTAIVTGAGGTTGVGIIEVFEVDLPQVPLVNISTRGRVLTGADVMIGGFIIQGDSPQTVIVRARGPSLAAQGVPGVLANPLLQLFAGATQIAVNDDWQSAANAAQIQSRGFAPAHPNESAILITLNPGAYTAIVTGAGGTTGVGIIEVFAQ